MENTHFTVTARWHGREYPAVLNGYGVATIHANAKPIEHEDTAELHRFEDDGCPLVMDGHGHCGLGR